MGYGRFGIGFVDIEDVGCSSVGSNCEGPCPLVGEASLPSLEGKRHLKGKRKRHTLPIHGQVKVANGSIMTKYLSEMVLMDILG